MRTTHSYRQRHLYEFDALPTPEHDLLWPAGDLPPQLVPYRDDNLNLAARYCLHYLATRDTHDWMHATVKAVAFESFRDALDEARGKVRTLQFSCWCNGGPYQEVRHRQHRHLVVVAPKGHFGGEFWDKVRVPKRDRPPGVLKFPCKGFQRILSFTHLVNTLLYLSNRESQCRFTFSNKLGRLRASDLNHIYLYRTLPADSELPLAVLSGEGLAAFLYQEKFQNVSVPRVAARPIARIRGQWKQKIADFYKHEKGIVLPVAKNFMATETPTPHHLHLLNGRKLYFEPSPEHERLDDDAWLLGQVEGGNVFYDNVEQELWTPRQRDQTVLNYYKPVLDENASLKRKLEALTNALDEKNAELSRVLEENAKLKGLSRKEPGHT